MKKYYLSHFNIFKVNLTNLQKNKDGFIYFFENFVCSKHSSGIYNYLPLGVILKDKICEFIHSRQSLIGPCVEVSNILDINLYKETNRINAFGGELFQLKSRDNKTLALSATAEEVFINDIIKSKISYKDLPVYYYQISQKFRDEIRPRNHLLRSKSFIMKDGYYFCKNQQELNEFYSFIYDEYKQTFDLLELEYSILQPEPGQMLEQESHEFIVKASDSNYNIVEFSSDEVKGIEIGHIFNLGSIYSKTFNKYYIDSSDSQNIILMGSYGIGISRLVYLMAMKMYNCVLPSIINLFDVLLIPRDKNIETMFLNSMSHFNIKILVNDYYKENYDKRCLSSSLFSVNYVVIEKNYKYLISNSKNETLYKDLSFVEMIEQMKKLI
ncbi:Proline--tRNA ligase [bacterium AB1]|nr:Proline--tRNA ligase [bacterium AB1]